MRLSEGFIVGGRYRIESLLASGSKFRVYDATTDDEGPGRVVVKVARHEGLSSLSGLQVGRSRVEQAWRVACTLHQHATSAIPLPIELVRMYPGDPEVRSLAVVDKKLVRAEPYAVLEYANGEPLAHVIQNERIDEERALLLGLRAVLVYRASLAAGWMQTDFSASNYMVDAAGENLSLVDPTGVDRASLLGEGDPIWRTFGTESRPIIERCASGTLVPPGLGRLLVSLFGGTSAPSWSVDAEALPRWRRLLASRRVPREFHTMLLGTLGYHEEFEAAPEQVENRLRALVRARPARVYAHVSKQSDTPYLIAQGERVAQRFEVLGPLGQGGRGFVYRARDTRSDVAVLIKANKYQYDAGSAFALELPTRRLELEHEFAILRTFASRTGMLPQPVALVRDRGRGAWFDLAPSLASDEPYLVMEHIKGIPLLDLLPAPLEGQAGYWKPNNRLRPGFALRLIAQIADLLRAFHALGYLVQDLKPENILFDPSTENVYLVDFAAVCPRLPNGALDQDSVAFGTQTHGFAAPEFATRWEACDDRFDIYSLGATAFHLLTGMNPERLAAEQGTEYPELPLGALEHLPAAVMEVVRRCIAPVDERFRSADEAFIAAERARLQLSRSRPLDVQGLDVAYEPDGVRLRWHLPVDPRVGRVRIVRVDGDDERVVFEGDAVTNWLDEDTEVGDRSYRVETGLMRRGDALHSRGRVVRTEAHPPPVTFEALPWFGCTRVRVTLAAHARDAVVRWAWDAPPTAPDEGEPIDVPAGEWVEHAPAGEGELHYAAFARYADDAHSAPRFGAARICAVLGAIDGFEAAQSIGCVTLKWRSTDARWRVRAVDADGIARWLTTERDGAARHAIDAEVAAGATLTYEWVATDGEVQSPPTHAEVVQRWPSPPDVRVEVGPSRVTLLSEAVDPRFDAFEVHLVQPSGLERLARGEGFPMVVEVPSDTPVSLAVQCCVDGTETGPGLLVDVVVPPADPAVSLEAQSALLPTTMRVTLPESARAWLGEYRLEVTEGRVSRLAWEGALHTLDEADVDATSRGPIHVEVEGTAAEPGEVREWALRLWSGDGDVVAVRLATVIALEQLPPPTLRAGLAEVVVEPGLVTPYLLRTWVEGDEGAAVESGPHEAPQRLAYASGTRVGVAWRRSIAGREMPWSAAAFETTLARPDAPTNVRVSRTAAGVRISWTPADEDALSVVTALPDRLVFVGEGATCLDVAPGGAERYSVATRRGALDSAPVEAQALAHRPVTGALAPLSTERAPAATVRLLQCVALGRRQRVVELATPGPPRWLAVVRASRKGPDPAAASALADPSNLGSAVLAITLSTAGRTLLPWSGAETIGVLEAAWEDDAPSWVAVTPFVEPVRGRLLGAMGGAGDALLLHAPGRATLPTELRLVTIGAQGTLGRTAHRNAAGVSTVPLPTAGVERVCGLALETPQPATVLVPMTSQDDLNALDALLWRDMAYGAVVASSRALSRHWQAPIVSQVIGQTSVFNALHDARHVVWSARVEDVSARGVARIAWEVRAAHGVVERVFRVRLSDARAWWAFATEVVAWAEAELAPMEDPFDAFGWVV